MRICDRCGVKGKSDFDLEINKTERLLHVGIAFKDEGLQRTETRPVAELCRECRLWLLNAITSMASEFKPR